MGCGGKRETGYSDERQYIIYKAADKAHRMRVTNAFSGVLRSVKRSIDIDVTAKRFNTATMVSYRVERRPVENLPAVRGRSIFFVFRRWLMISHALMIPMK